MIAKGGELLDLGTNIIDRQKSVEPDRQREFSGREHTRLVQEMERVVDPRALVGARERERGNKGLRKP